MSQSKMDLDAANRVKGALDVMRNTEGWKIYTAFLEDQIKVIEKAAGSVKTGDEAMKLCGQVSALRMAQEWPKLQSDALESQIKTQQTRENKP